MGMREQVLCSLCDFTPLCVHLGLSAVRSQGSGHTGFLNHTHWEISFTSYNNFPMVTLSLYTSKAL